MVGNFGFRKKRDCTIYVAKTKTLISFAFTAKLICLFVFAYAKRWFSHDAAHMLNAGFLMMWQILIGNLPVYRYKFQMKKVIPSTEIPDVKRVKYLYIYLEYLCSPQNKNKNKNNNKTEWYTYYEP